MTGAKFRTLAIIDETSLECLALIVVRQLNHKDVLAATGGPAPKRLHRHIRPSVPLHLHPDMAAASLIR